MAHDYHHNRYTISTDPARLDHEAIIGFLARAYWATTRPREVIERSIQHSLCFGVYHEQQQVGFARVVSDYATFAYLADVFIDDAHRGHGLGKWLVGVIRVYPELQGVRRWLLATRDAHGLYQQFGFVALPEPEIWMQASKP